MEEMSDGATIFEFGGVSGHRREIIVWLVKNRVDDGINPADIMDADAIGPLAGRLRTAQQIEMNHTLAFEHAFRPGKKRVSAKIVEQVLSWAIDDLEATVTRNGYEAPALTVPLRPSPPKHAIPGRHPCRRPHARVHRATTRGGRAHLNQAALLIGILCEHDPPLASTAR